MCLSVLCLSVACAELCGCCFVVLSGVCCVYLVLLHAACCGLYCCGCVVRVMFRCVLCLVWLCCLVCVDSVSCVVRVVVCVGVKWCVSLLCLL